VNDLDLNLDQKRKFDYDI